MSDAKDTGTNAALEGNAIMPAVMEIVSTDILQKEIDRFIDVARKRSESDPDQRRRSDRRYHRSWPLLVCTETEESSAALHNASRHGVAFLSARPVPADAIVYLRFFCHDDSCSLVPAVVRHATLTAHGYLVGCEFAVEDERLCRQALERTESLRTQDVSTFSFEAEDQHVNAMTG